MADVSKNVNACKKFFLLEVNARVLAEAMNELGIEDIDASPSHEKFNVTKDDSKQKKLDFLKYFASTVVKKYILKESRVQCLLDKIHDAKEEMKPNADNGR